MKDGKNLGDATGTGWTDNAAAAAELKAIYKSGKNSMKGSGAIRTLAGFSTGAATKSSKNYDDAPDHNPDVDMVKEPFFKVANAYWTTHGPKTANSWADAIITAAFDGAAVGDIDFNTTGADFRVETIGKVSGRRTWNRTYNMASGMPSGRNMTEHEHIIIYSRT